MNKLAAAALALLLPFCLSSDIVGGEVQDDEISVEHFWEMSEDDQLRVIASQVRSSMSQLSNMSIHVRQVSSIVKSNSDGTPDSEAQLVATSDQILHRRGDAYLFVIKKTIPKSPEPLYTSWSAYDPSSGISKMMAVHSGVKRTLGRISTAHDPILKDFNYGRIIAGIFPEVESIPQRLDWKIGLFLSKAPSAPDWIRLSETDSGELSEVSLAIGFHESTGNSTVTFEEHADLDISRGFAVTRWKRTWKQDHSGKPVELSLEVVAEDFRMVGGAWFPFNVTYSPRSSLSMKDRIVMFESNVKEVSVGDVRESDVSFEFPENAEIHDMIENRVLVAGHGVKATHGAIGKVSTGRSYWPWLAGGNLIVLGIGGLVAARIWMRRE